MSPEPIRISEWPTERLEWELEHKADVLHLAQIAFELMWRESNHASTE